MSEKIQETQQRLKDLGYFASEDLSKLVLLFEASGKKNKKNIPTLLLQGKSGAGKTFLAETFSKMISADEKFVQCFPRMGTENFQYDVNIEGVMKQDAETSIKEGILLQTLQQSKKGPVVLVIDELDKARPEVDSFLLDFLENGRLTTGTDTYEKGQYPIYTFITSNDKREIDEALLNRSKRIEVPRPNKELFLEILGLPENHYLGYIYDKCPNFSIRQARQYIEDLEVLGVEIDEDALSQYINLDELDVMSLADLQHISEMENGDLEFELPDLERCYISINSNNQEGWIKIFNTGNKGNFRLYSDDDEQGKFYVDIDTLEQLKMANEYMDFDDYDNRYKGWFEYSLSDEEIESDNIIWAGNKNKKDGTRFGLKIDGDNMFRIAMNRGATFVYLDSSSEHTLENFLGQEKDEIEQEYEIDSEYGDEGRDYDD
jgi:MoxR-like ATPase